MAEEHIFPRLTHVGGRRLSTHIQSFVTPMCSKRHLEIRYDERSVPEWMIADKFPEWITPFDPIITLEQMHRNTIEDLLEASIGDPPPRDVYDSVEEDRVAWGLSRRPMMQYECEVNKHNFRRVLREIEVRGAYHHAGKLGKWKSPIYSQLRQDVPTKGAHTVKPNCGGGGGGIACC